MARVVALALSRAREVDRTVKTVVIVAVDDCHSRSCCCCCCDWLARPSAARPRELHFDVLVVLCIVVVARSSATVTVLATATARLELRELLHERSEVCWHRRDVPHLQERSTFIARHWRRREQLHESVVELAALELRELFLQERDCSVDLWQQRSIGFAARLARERSCVCGALRVSVHRVRTAQSFSKCDRRLETQEVRGVSRVDDEGMLLVLRCLLTQTHALTDARASSSSCCFLALVSKSRDF